MISNRFLALLLFAALACSSSVLAAAAKKAPPPVDPRILIKSVDQAKQEVTFIYQRYKDTRVYLVDDLTKVTADGHPGSIKDIAKGEQVFDYVERDGHSLDSITVGAAQPAPKN